MNVVGEVLITNLRVRQNKIFVFMQNILPQMQQIFLFFFTKTLTKTAFYPDISINPASEYG